MNLKIKQKTITWYDVKIYRDENKCQNKKFMELDNQMRKRKIAIIKNAKRISTEIIGEPRWAEGGHSDQTLLSCKQLR